MPRYFKHKNDKLKAVDIKPSPGTSPNTILPTYVISDFFPPKNPSMPQTRKIKIYTLLLRVKGNILKEKICFKKMVKMRFQARKEISIPISMRPLYPTVR
jgi:hypothetical protein